MALPNIWSSQPAYTPSKAMSFEQMRSGGAVDYGAQAPGGFTFTGSGGGGGWQGGGGGTGATAPQQQQAQAPMEPMPEQSGFDFSGAIQGAMDALGQQEQATRGGYETALGQAERGTAQRKEETRGEETRRLGELGGQRTRETERGESAIAEARRTTSQLMQGISSRFGGRSTMGQASSEILGAAGATNIAQNRQAMQYTMGQIGQSEENVRSETSRMINEASNQLETAKENARVQLNQALANIASARGALQSQKSEMQMNALQSYQQMVADVNARNTSFKQQLFMEAQKATEQLNTWKQSAIENFNTTFEGFTSPEVNVGGQTYGAVPSGSGLKGVTYLKGKEDEDESAAGSVKL